MRKTPTTVLFIVLSLALLMAACADSAASPTPSPPPPTPQSPYTQALTIIPTKETIVGPAARIYHTMVYEINDDRVLLFGGNTYHDPEMDLDDVWAYDVTENDWDEVGMFEAGLNDIGAEALAYDQESDRVIVFNVKGETWAYQFNTRQWEKMTPAEAPSGRCGHTAVYDSESDRIILFGGFKCINTGSPLYDDTWVYDYNTDTWTEMKPPTGPSARVFHGMAYDIESDQAIVWGGRPHEEVKDIVVWAYDYNSNTWTALESASGPPLRFAYHTMVYSPKLDKVIVYGGVVLDSTGWDGDLIDQIWTYDININTWTLLKPDTSPSARAKHAMVYNSAIDKIILFGGVTGELYSDNGITAETWIYDPTNNEWSNMTVTSARP